VKQALAAAARDPRLGAALGLHRLGKLPEAMKAYELILDADVGNADATFLCGMAALEASAFKTAAGLLMDAVRIDPARADFHANLGLALARSNNLMAGLSPLVRAMLLGPDQANFSFNLGQVLDRVGRGPRAYMAFRASAHLQPDHPASWIELGAVARTEGKPAIANLALLRALKLDEKAPHAWFNIGLLRADQGLDDDAETGFRQALELDPSYVEAIGNLGNHLRGLRRREEARVVLLDGLARFPLSERLWAGLSAVEFDDDRISSADIAARRASLLDPGLIDGIANLAQCWHRTGLTGEAVGLGRRAERLAPDDLRIRFNQATYLLGDGFLGAGWDAYEARLGNIPDSMLSRLPGKRWKQGPPPGRHVLVVAEQGIGDELLFATCLPDLEMMRSRGELHSVTMECDARLELLVRRSFPCFQTAPRITSRIPENTTSRLSDEAVAAKVDCHVYAGTLPGIFRRTLGEFHQPKAVFRADSEKVSNWRRILRSETEGPVFGLTWRSMNKRDRSSAFYPPIQSLGPILGIPNVTFVTLQYDDPEPDLRRIEESFGIHVVRPIGLDPMNDLDDVAALLSATDGLVSAYTATLNLAGILGVPAYSATYGYYWPTLGTRALPWYPSINIEMRTGDDGWDDVIQRLAARLQSDIKA
jgi:tetratricopeptide (TPR) repeat protein